MARMMERVESTLKEAARSRDGKTLSLKLEPVDLGKVKVDVSLRDGALHARISPENQQVMQGLREHAHELQGALRKLGLDVDSVSVSITADEFRGELTSDQGAFDGSSFQQERNNMPQDRSQLAENTIGNKLAESLNAGGQSKVSKVLEMVDHWIA
jgi:flagellar hook-length control protein FliK